MGITDFEKYFDLYKLSNDKLERVARAFYKLKVSYDKDTDVEDLLRAYDEVYDMMGTYCDETSGLISTSDILIELLLNHIDFLDGEICPYTPKDDELSIKVNHCIDSPYTYGLAYMGYIPEERKYCYSIEDKELYSAFLLEFGDILTL